MNGYEVHGQPTSTTVTIPSKVGGQDLTGVAGAYTTSYTYTADGRPDLTSLPAAGGLPAETVNLAYDAANQPSGMDAGARGLYVRAADYAPTGEMVRLSLGNTHANVENRDYQFGTRRLIGSAVVAEQADGTAHDVRHSAFTWDDAGNLTSAFDTPAANLGGTVPDRQCFGYDGLRRLTSAWTPRSAGCTTAPTVAGLGGAAPYWQDYTYDAVGNRTGTVEHSLPNGTASRTSTYTYPTGTPAVRPHAVTKVIATGRGAGTSSFAYDQAGNMTGRAVVGSPVQKLVWDPEGELDTAAEDSSGDGAVSDAESAAGDKYVYTADGDRLLRTQDGATTVYLGAQELTVKHATGQVTGQRYYTFAGQTVAVRTGLAYSTVSSIFSDRHGTGEVQIPNVTGARVHRYTDPFGVPRGPQAGGWTGDHGFLDKPKDTSGLTAIGARMYDPSLGKFISVDPIMDLADPQQWNPYAYSGNNPTTFTDPTGKRYEECGTTHNCQTNNKGKVTSAKKYKKHKPTIWDIRARHMSYLPTLTRNRITASASASVFLSQPRSVQRGSGPTRAEIAKKEAILAQQEISELKMQQARATAALARENAALRRLAAAIGEDGCGALPGGCHGKASQVNGGVCAIVCFDVVAGGDFDRGQYVTGALGFGIEAGVSFGASAADGVSPGPSTGISGTAAMVGGVNATGTIADDGSFAGWSTGTVVSYGPRLGSHVWWGYTWTER